MKYLSGDCLKCGKVKIKQIKHIIRINDSLMFNGICSVCKKPIVKFLKINKKEWVDLE